MQLFIDFIIKRRLKMAGDVDSNMADDDTRDAVMELASADAPGEANELAKYEDASFQVVSISANDFRQILSQRFIKIFVGSSTEPYLIQQAVLEHTSEYFVRAIKNEHLGGASNLESSNFQKTTKKSGNC